MKSVEVICYAQPRGYGKTYYELEKLKKENRQLQERIAYLERSNNRREETILELRDENVVLLTKIDKLTNNLENSIESINVKLNDKEIRIKDGIIVNPIGEFRSVRLKAIRMKCKELLEILKN